MKKCMKSLLGITLAIATLLSVVPVGVFAAAQQPTAIRSSIVAVKDVTLTVPFTSAGEANTTAKVIKQSGEAVWSFRVDGGNTLAYCVDE